MSKTPEIGPKAGPDTAAERTAEVTAEVTAETTPLTVDVEDEVATTVVAIAEVEAEAEADVVETVVVPKADVVPQADVVETVVVAQAAPAPVPAQQAATPAASGPAPLVPPAPVPGGAFAAPQYSTPQYSTPPYAAPQVGTDPQAGYAVYPASVLAPQPKPKRAFPWRWAGAVVVLLAVGGASAFGVLAQKRTDLPGLQTAADGRYDFAPLAMPSLAPGQSDPLSQGNAGFQHLSDIRKLLLPAPVGATKDASLPGASGWVSESASVAVTGDSSGTTDFAADGWRHTAGAAWKTPDGADTKIYLLQFIDDASCADASSAFTNFGGNLDAATQTLNVLGKTAVAYTTVKKGSTTTRSGYATVGDTVFLIVYTSPSSVGLAPFEQEVDLQAELLQ